jgi:hypothetical protein
VAGPDPALQPERFVARTHRLIASRFPTVGVFDDIADTEEDLRAAFQLESLTNGRIQATERLLSLPLGGIVAGPTASIVMAAFLHCAEGGGRFSDNRLGAWYAATDIETAVEETVFHNERRLRLSDAGFPTRLQMRELVVDLDLDVLDIRGLAGERPDLYDPDSYLRSQAFAAERRWPYAEPGLDGLVYDSVRRKEGQNVCVFRPGAVPLPIVQGAHYEYAWDGAGELTVLALTKVERPRPSA